MANVLDKTLDEVMSDVIKKLEPTMRRLKPKVKKEPIAYVSPKVDPPVAPFTGGLGGFSASSVGGIPQAPYTQGIAVISASYGDSMIPTDPSRESLADPEVDAAINNVIAKLRNKKEEVRYARGVDTDLQTMLYEWKGY